MVLIGVAMLLSVHLAPAQRPASTSRGAEAAASSRPCSSQSDPQACERGWQMLDVGELETSDLRESGMRAYAQLLAARAYAKSARSKAVELLNTAFTATLAMPDGHKKTAQGRIEAIEKLDLQRRILDSLVTLAPEQAEEKLPLAVPAVRERVFAALIGYYQENRRLDEAVETINRIARDAGFPYIATSRLMTVLPPEKAAERRQLFAAALNSFRTHPPEPDSLGFDAAAFPGLIVQHWKGLPVSLVREAIDEVLKQAETKPDGVPPIRLSVGYAGGGGAALSSMYEYRLFQLLPVLRQIDPGSAESLLRDHDRVAKQFEAYEQAGSPSIRFVGATRSGTPLRQTRSEVRAPAPGESAQDVVQRVLAVQDVSARASLLLATARREQTGHPSIAVACLDKLVDPVAGQLPSVSEQVSTLTEAAGLYLDMQEAAGAARAIAAARAAVEKLYAVDNDSSTPNQALKAYWPSTSAYGKLVRLAARVSPDLALRMIKETGDDEIRPLLRLMLAGKWIGVPFGSLTIIAKDGGMSEESDPETQR